MLTLVVAFFALLGVAYSDLRYRLIPNWLVGIIAVIAIMFIAYTNNLEQIAYAPLILIVGLVFWKLNIFAGGDVKLLAVLVPAVDKVFYLELFILVMFLWGVTALFVWLHHKLFSPHASVTVPFGVPISIGCWLGMFASV